MQVHNDLDSDSSDEDDFFEGEDDEEEEVACFEDDMEIEDDAENYEHFLEDD